MDVNHQNLIRQEYGGRALGYDHARGGWHIRLGQDFVNWVTPLPGETALDLACGTGLVTVPMAMKLGSKGRVVAVDLTREMIQEGKDRLFSLQQSNPAQEIAAVSWIEADITSEDMLTHQAILEVLHDNGGFDIISICSALVLLPNQQASLQSWVDKLLKKGGRIIVDVPDESPTLQLLMTYHLPAAMGLPTNMAEGRLWVKNRESLAQMLRDVGLTIDQMMITRSYIGETWYDSDEETALQVLNTQIREGYTYIEENGRSVEAREVWPEIWKRAVRRRPDGSGGVEEAHRLYVCVGRKN